jgi:hypothetical protein
MEFAQLRTLDSSDPSLERTTRTHAEPLSLAGIYQRKILLLPAGIRLASRLIDFNLACAHADPTDTVRRSGYGVDPVQMQALPLP